MAKVQTLAEAQAEITALKAKLEKRNTLSLKVSEKTQALSLYGLGRFPVTLYAGQWERLITFAPEITAFIAAHDELARKE